VSATALSEPRAVERRVRDRRLERSRRTLELILDGVFRPGGWAARLSYHLGLQGRVRASTSEIHLLDRGAASAGRRPLRIAFGSDFHAGATTHPTLLADACDALAAFAPDVLLLGGDFVSVRASYIDRLAPHLARIPAPLGKFAVLGNHDLRANIERVESALEAAGVQMLTNRHVALPAPYADVSICGLDDPTRGEPRADQAMDDATGTRIVLMHSPEGLEAIGDREYALAVCGHTHGGQVALPWGTPVLVPGGALNRRYCRGEFHVGDRARSTLLVSRGIGCSTIPVRLFAAPEVHLCLIT
jgi:predicted MPP superfamily phosphohydrolase